jgi:hypothetical protein
MSWAGMLRVLSQANTTWDVGSRKLGAIHSGALLTALASSGDKGIQTGTMNGMHSYRRE